MSRSELKNKMNSIHTESDAIALLDEARCLFNALDAEGEYTSINGLKKNAADLVQAIDSFLGDNLIAI